MNTKISAVENKIPNTSSLVTTTVLNKKNDANDRSQKTFTYEPTLHPLKLKKDKSTDSIFSWKSKGIFT